MLVDRLMNNLLEDYLRGRGVRFFRGHHDDEFFFLLDLPAPGFRTRPAGRLDIHLGVCGAGRDAVRVHISPDRFYPADQRDRLAAVAARWNAGDPWVRAAVHESCDPALVGVDAAMTRRPVDSADLADFIDHAVDAAVELFGLMCDASRAEAGTTGGLREAG